ncbi:MAG: hypothetical protein BroJett006_09410 [Betaproteobacteria bacterium]|nr:MAG: hypothetical protein BroJett006_09410 [Betaproteobacteria bacterium]
MARTPSAGLAEARDLVATIPPLETCDLAAPEVQRWIGRSCSLVDEFGDLIDKIGFNSAARSLASTLRARSAHEMRALLHKILANLEQRVGEQKGAEFIKAKDVFAGFVSILDTIRRATRIVWIVDPYMDETILRDYGAAVPERVLLRLLTTKREQNATIVPAVQKWQQTYREQRPVEGRLAPKRRLHDRFIAIDGKEVWLLSQSLREFAEQAPATVVLFDPSLAADKLDAYEAIWQEAQAI